MASFQQSVTVNASPEKAFQYLADLTRHSEWAAHSLEVESASAAPAAVGGTVSTIGHQMGTHRATVTLTELQPNQRVAYEAEDDTGQFRHWIDISAKEGVTEITKGMEPMRTNLMLTLMTPLWPLVIPSGLRGDLQRIKQRLEAEG